MAVAWTSNRCRSSVDFALISLDLCLPTAGNGAADLGVAMELPELSHIDRGGSSVSTSRPGACNTFCKVRYGVRCVFH